MKIIPVFLPYAGCKHRCVFCDQVGATGVSKKISPRELESLLERYANPQEKYEVAFYGGTFTALPVGEQLEYLKVIRRWMEEGIVEGIRISTRPDEIDEERADFLKKWGVKTIEIGVQSMDDRVLDTSKRGHTSDDSRKAISVLKKFEFVVGAHLMVGLPGSSFESDIRSALEIARIGVDIARIHPTLVFKTSELRKMMERGEYSPLTLDEAVDLVSDMVMILEARNVRVIRIGLYVPPELRSNIVAGPYHPSFGDLVRVHILRKLIEEFNAKEITVDEKRAGWLFGYDGKKWLRGRGIEVLRASEFKLSGMTYEKAVVEYCRRREWW